MKSETITRLLSSHQQFLDHILAEWEKQKTSMCDDGTNHSSEIETENEEEIFFFKRLEILYARSQLEYISSILLNPSEGQLSRSVVETHTHSHSLSLILDLLRDYFGSSSISLALCLTAVSKYLDLPTSLIQVSSLLLSFSSPLLLIVVSDSQKTKDGDLKERVKSVVDSKASFVEETCPETCPACGSIVDFHSLRVAQCREGHTFCLYSSINDQQKENNPDEILTD